MSDELAIFGRIFSRRCTALCVLILTATCCTGQLFVHRGLPVAHDMVFHLFQADQFVKSVADGVIQPRWVLDSNNGYGSPNFIFYAPLSYYLVALLNLITRSPVVSLILAIWSSFVLSGITMFLAVRKISGRKGSLLSAGLYQLLPFHLLNLYDRGAYAELCAYTWFPLIILFAHQIISEQRAPLAPIGLSLSYGGLILTHLVSAFIFSIVVGVYLAVSYILSKHAKALLRVLFSLFLGLGISSLYLIPVILERKYVQIDRIFNYGFSDFHKNFLFLPDNFRAHISPFHVSMQIAVVLEVFLFATLIVLVSRNHRPLLRESRYVIFMCLFLFSFFLTIPLSEPLWEHLPFFAALQFPWRWVSLMELSICFLVGAVFSGGALNRLMTVESNTRPTIYCIVALSLTSLFLIAKSNSAYSQEFLNKILTPELVRQYDNLPREYTPMWAKDVEQLASETNVPKVSTVSGSTEYRVLQWHSESRIIGIKAATPSLMRISTFYYPGWEAIVDGKKTAITVEKGTGAVLVNIPQGEHTLKLIFGDTPSRIFARWASLISCAVLSAFGLILGKLRRAGDAATCLPGRNWSCDGN